eukprot:1126403-Prorocentrum_minimum.AAC.2
MADDCSNFILRVIWPTTVRIFIPWVIWPRPGLQMEARRSAFRGQTGARRGQFRGQMGARRGALRGWRGCMRGNF